MTFASMTLSETAPAKENNPPVEPAAANPISVKVSFGNDIRRVTFNGASFDPLRDLLAGLFVLDPATVVVKYQDEDEDKITMSSDGELQEALRLSKGTLRLFVENKVANPPQEEPVAHDPQGQAFWHGPFRGRHGFGGRGGFGHHGFGGHPAHYGPHAHHGHHGPHGPHGHHGHHGWGGRGGFGFPHGGFGGRGGFSPAGPFPPASPGAASFGSHPIHAHGEFSPASPKSPAASAEGPAASFCHPLHAHGEFSAAPEGGEYAQMSHDRKAFKERKMIFKQTIAEMKANAVTKEDLKAIKKYKEEAKEEFKAFKKQCEKRDKHDKKRDKAWDKHHEKGERLMARHVADVTIPDNSVLPPDTAVVKTWKLKNPGHLAWPANSQLLFISHAGDQLSGPERVVVQDAVLPQQEVDVSVPLLTPGEPGRYVGYYRMATPDGAKFGQRVWVSFIIAPQGQANTTTTTAPSAPTAMDQ